MKATTIDASVLQGQMSTGAVLPVGPLSGDAGLPDTGVAEAAEPMPPHISDGGPAPIPTPAPSAAVTVDGGPHTVDSQYSTQGPIPKG